MDLDTEHFAFLFNLPSSSPPALDQWLVEFMEFLWDLKTVFKFPGSF